MKSAWVTSLITSFHVSGTLAISLLRRGRDLILPLLASVFLLAGPANAQDAYQLGPGDRLSVRVLAWNSLDLEFEMFEGLSGIYQIDSDGSLALPLIGPVAAAGLDVASLSNQVGQQYQRRLGLAEMPSATVQIEEFRPIYVLGDVARPGRYEFEFGLTPTRAIALAGGLYRPDEGGGFGEGIRSVGRLTELGDDLARERMRAARLRAEMAAQNDFAMPALPPHPDGGAAQDALFQHEGSLFDSRLQQVESSLASIDETRELLETEITALEEKRAGILRQLELVRESVGNFEALRERGLARSPTLITLQQTLIDLEARELDTETGIFRARQQLSELDRDAGDIRSNRQVQVLRDLQTAESEIQRMETQTTTTRNFLAFADAVEAEQEDEVAVRLEYTILRGTDQQPVPATDSTPLAPLDVLQVEALTVAD